MLNLQGPQVWPELGQTNPHLEPGDLWLGPASDLAGESPHLSFSDHRTAQLGSKLWWALSPDARTGLHRGGCESVPEKKSAENPAPDTAAIHISSSLTPSKSLKLGPGTSKGQPSQLCASNTLLMHPLQPLEKSVAPKPISSTSWACS